MKPPTYAYLGSDGVDVALLQMSPVVLGDGALVVNLRVFFVRPRVDLIPRGLGVAT